MVIGYSLLATCSQFKRLTPADRLSPGEKLDYLVLLSLDERAARQFATGHSASARAEFLDWFWTSSPAVPIEDPAGRRDRLYERARQAREFFGAVDLLSDERVLTYIRYGPPARESFEPAPVHNESVRVIVNPAEIWTYDRLGRQFDFVKTGTAFRLVGETRFGPAAVAPALEEVDLGRAAPEPRPDAGSLDLRLNLARFFQETDSVDVELSFGIPLAEIIRGTEPGTQPLIWVRIEFRPGTVAGRIAESLWVSTALDADTTINRLAVARRTFVLPADVYTVTVSVALSDGSARGRSSRQLNLIDYVRLAQPGSDIAFYALADSAFQSPQFEHAYWRRLAPLVLADVQSGRTFYALYELYNLGLNQDGRHEVQADYDIIEEATRQLAVIPTPTRFSSVLGPRATLVERVHTMDLRPGSYILVARARDLVRNQDISMTARFRILPQPD